MFFFRTYDVVDFQGLCAWTFRIAEDMELGHVQTFDEAISFVKVFRGFTSCADNNVYSDKRIRDKRTNLVDFGCEQSRVVAPSHQFEHGVGAGL